MLELNQDTLKFTFPEVHPDAELTITFHRTLRIPDDDKSYPLPPSLGPFPVKHVDDHRERVPAKWLEHGGVMLPMYQSEALWISFSSKHLPKHRTPYPFAIKIGTGKISAVTGDEWEKGLKEKDYVIIPEQPWVDGYKVDENEIRQFVAAPLGWGFTAEEQLTGKADHGGIQIEVLPMHRSIFDKKFPEREVPTPRGGVMRGMSFGGGGGGGTYTSGGDTYGATGVYSMSLCSTADSSRGISSDASDLADLTIPTFAAEMGVAAGGRMKQEIFEDKHGKDCWREEGKARCFVHLTNSMAWEAITEHKPPATPVTADLYTRQGYPWFDYYDENQTALKATEKLKGLQSVMKMGFQKGMNILPENTPTDPSKQVHVIKGKSGQIRVGAW